MELLKKLRLKTNQPLWLINAPANMMQFFADFAVKQKPGKEKPVSQIMLFVKSGEELSHHLLNLEGYIGHHTLFWICYPKKTGSIPSDLILMKTWDIVFSSGYRGQTSVSIDNDWTGMRFTNAPRTRPSDSGVPMEERKHEGIDYANRTTTLPEDAQALVKKYKGLPDYFYAQSFTCQKEYIMAITEAKKPETRTRRIEKMIEMLLPKMLAMQQKAKK